MSSPKTKRGGKYKGKAPAPKPAPKPAPQNTSALTKTIDSKGREHYVENKYGIRVSHAMISKLGEDRAAEEAKNITDALDMFGLSSGEAKEAVSRIDSDRQGSGTYASFALGSKEINANPSWFKNLKKFNRQYQADVASGYHPKGTTSADVLSHEAGHAVGRYIGGELYKIYQHEHGNNFFMAASYVMGGQAEKDIVSAACKTVKQATKQNYSTLKRNISGYAAKNHQECFAEAVADYRRNGSKASPLSIEIVKEAQKTLRDIRKKKKKYGI